jgi:hypothetical protein
MPRVRRVRGSACSFVIYALGFGNHLSMILLFVPFSIFIILATPDRRALFRPSTIAIALGVAILGALQYWPNFMSTAHTVHGLVPWSERVANFWFDTTKADWRDTMVLGVREDQLTSRLGMWWFDARQQFGIVGVVLAIVGAVRLWTMSKPWAALVILGYAINTLFAFTYNVGDTHVFYLPSHLFAAFAAGAAVGQSGRFKSTRLALQITAVLAIGFAGWQARDTWPAVDRHDDRRAETLVTRMALGINPQTGVLVTNMNWQVENALLYYSRWERHDVPWVRLPDVELHFPFLVRDNEAISRDVILDRYSAGEIVSAFGPLYPMQADPIRASADLIESVSALAAGTPYVLCVLTPPREESLDQETLQSAIRLLTAARRCRGGVGARRQHTCLPADRGYHRRTALDHPCGARSLSTGISPAGRTVYGPYGVMATVRHLSPSGLRPRDSRTGACPHSGTRGEPGVVRSQRSRIRGRVCSGHLRAGERYRISSVSPALARLLQQGWYRRFQ